MIKGRNVDDKIFRESNVYYCNIDHITLSPKINRDTKFFKNEKFI